MARTLEMDIFNRPIKRAGAINAPVKGSANELVCAKCLFLWVREEFYRVPQSGGLRRNHTEGIVGDLTCRPDFDFPFTIETKHYKALDDIIIRKIWKQALSDGIRAKKLPIAMLRANRQKKFKHEGDEYMDYIVVLDARYGGTLLSYRATPERTIHSDKNGYTLMLFKFSEIVKKYPFPALAKAIIKTDLIQKFIEYENR